MNVALLMLIAAPLAAALSSLVVRTRPAMERLQLAHAAVLWAAMAVVVAGAVMGGHGDGSVAVGSLLRADRLSAFMDFMLAFVGGTALWYAVGYMGEELSRGHLSFPRYRRFFVYFDLFLFAMILAVNLDNIALMWIAVEASTISAALSVGFDRTKAALEAGWKYIVLNFVGIALALFGTVLVYYTSEHTLGVTMEALSWTALHDAAARLNPVVLKMAFVFVMIGYGTKAGVAPMHTWLPDAHAEAPTPVSAMLSGLMLNLGLYAVLRLKSIVDPAVGPAFTGSIMLGLGLLSMAIAATFMLIQRDYKRLLAYSSIEHMGIAFIGFGVGGPLGLFGGFFHMLNHALAKSTAFYAAGMVLLRHGHKVIERVTGLVRGAPAAGSGLVLAAVALAGLPPFGLFVSEVLIATAAYRYQHGLAYLFLALLALAFATLLAPLFRMTLGEAPPVSLAVTNRSDRFMTSALGINLAALCVIGLPLPLISPDWFLPLSALVDAQAGLP